MALELVKSSTWMLKSPVMTNSWGVVDTVEIRVWKSFRHRGKDTDSRDLAVEGRGR